jgi:dipeptidyl aminopeptidase/acylaminoacyl peptidase
MRGSLVLGAALLTLILAAGGVDAKPESQRDGRITVITGESGEARPSPRLVVMDADGKNARLRLGYVSHASLSPNGRSIAYDPLGARDTRVIAADGRPRDQLLVRNGRSADWSPTGAAIAFVRGSDIWVKDLQSRTQRLVVRNAEAPDWSPDGKKLAFSRGSCVATTSKSCHVWAVDLATKRAQRLIRGAVNPRWSPEGHSIAFERYGQGESVIYIARADGTAERRLAEGDSAAWSPDGSELTIADFNRVIRMRLDGTHRRFLYAPRNGYCACRYLDWVR